MDKWIDIVSSACAKSKETLLLIAFLLSLLLLHRYIFLYGDDLYYARDAQYGLSNLPHFALSELKLNGRVWIGLALLAVLKDQITYFRIINPIIITLTALLMAKMSTRTMNNAPIPKNLGLAVFLACLFFWFLPIEISHTTIYYAATSFNYLYPTTLVMLYAYILCHYSPPKINYLLIILAFFAGSSTQQAGMIAIGYTVLFTVYLRLAKKKKQLLRTLWPYYLALFSGFSFILYGSFYRLLWEKGAGNETNLPEAINGLIKVNIFSRPVAMFVLLVCLCCIFWFRYLAAKSPRKSMPFILVCLLFVFTLSLGMFSYIYTLLVKEYPAEVFHEGVLNGKLGLYLLCFVLFYMLSILVCTGFILWKQGNPLLFFHTINAIGAQLMLLAVNARFAHTYKIMFPSLLLLSIFVIYSILTFYRNKTFVSLAIIMTVLPFSLSGERTVWLILLVIALLLAMNFRFFTVATMALSLGLALFFFSFAYLGYQEQAPSQFYNLEMIKEYHANGSQGALTLQRVPLSLNGYNLNNWNKMPYFMKECYQINPQTPIQYLEE